MTTRVAVVEEARSWLGTPFVKQGDVKGVGVDCVMLVVRVYEPAIGRIPDPRPYPSGWYLRDSRYLELIAPYVEVNRGEPQPGDLALFRVGRAPAHAGIVTKWPRIIHAHGERGVVEDSYIETDLAGRFSSAWSVRGVQ